MAPAIPLFLLTGFVLVATVNVVPAIGTWCKMTISVRDAGRPRVEPSTLKVLKRTIPML